MVGCAGRGDGRSSATTAATSSPSRSPGSSTGWCCSTSTGRPSRPAKLWNDTTSAPQAERLVLELGTRAMGGADMQRPRRIVHDHEVGVGRRARTGRAGAGDTRHAPARLPDVAAVRRPRDRPRRRFWDGMVRPGRRRLSPSPARPRGRDVHGRASCHGCLAPTERRGHGPTATPWPSSGSAARCSWPRAAATTWVPRSVSACAAATWRSRSAPRARCSRSRRHPRATSPARWPASRAPTARSCRSCARSTRPRSRTRWPGGSARTPPDARDLALARRD